MTDTSAADTVPIATPPAVNDARRMRAMRYIAVGSFCYLVTQGAAITAFLLLSSERTAISAVFAGMSPFMIATNAMFISVVLGYMGISTTEKYLTLTGK